MAGKLATMNLTAKVLPVSPSTRVVGRPPRVIHVKSGYPDFLGVCRGMAIAIEAKEITSKSSLELDGKIVKTPQIEWLIEFDLLGGHSFILVEFRRIIKKLLIDEIYLHKLTQLGPFAGWIDYARKNRLETKLLHRDFFEQDPYTTKIETANLEKNLFENIYDMCKINFCEY